MKDENQIIGFVKWFFKWGAIAVLGLVVLAVAIWGMVAGYDHFTYEIPKRNIEIVVVSPEEQRLEYIQKHDEQIGAVDFKFPDGTIIENVPVGISADDFVQKVHNAGILLEEIEIKRALALGKARARVALKKKLSGDGLVKTKAESSGDIGKLCDDPFPIFVSFVNNSRKTIEYIDFDIIAKQPEHSTDIADYGDYSSDRILKPGEGWGNCWKVNLKSEYRDKFERFRIRSRN
jgi:hypothetical protein